MNHRVFLRIKELASAPGHPGRLPLSANSIWRLVRQGQFPAPVKLSAHCTAWRVEDVQAWESQRQGAK